MKNPTLIGLTGHAGSGKDTVREILERQYGYTGLALADPIRAMLRTLLGHCGESDACMTDRTMKEQPVSSLGVSYRHLAQSLGTEWGRSLSDDFWTQIAEKHIHALCANVFAKEQRFVVSDIRFRTEADWVRSLGGEVWHIRRDGVAPVRTHQSEAEIDAIEVDFVVSNNGNIAELEASIFATLWRQSAVLA